MDPGTGGYAVIYQWDNPGKTVRKTGDDFDYYNVGDGTDGNGALTIPHTVTVNGTDYPILKVTVITTSLRIIMMQMYIQVFKNIKLIRRFSSPVLHLQSQLTLKNRSD